MTARNLPWALIGFFGGHGNKLTLDWSRLNLDDNFVNDKESDQTGFAFSGMCLSEQWVREVICPLLAGFTVAMPQTACVVAAFYGIEFALLNANIAMNKIYGFADFGSIMMSSHAGSSGESEV